MPALRPEKIDKGLAHLQRLKRSVEEDSTLLAGEILLLLRVLYSDQSNWYSFVNSFDLLQPVVIDGNTGDEIEITSGVMCAKRLAPQPKSARQSLSLEELIGLNIFSIGATDFSLKALLNAVAYSGDVHPEPSANKNDLLLIKSQFTDVAPDFVKSLIREFGVVLLTSFQEVFRPWEQNFHLNSPDHFRQPQIIRSGSIIPPFFDNAFSQCPIQPKKGKGIRILFDYCPVPGSTNGTILSLGHRSENTLRIQVMRYGDRLVFKIGDTQRTDAIVWSRPGMLETRFRWIEICTYPDGTVVASVDGYQCGLGVLPSCDVRSSCKLVIGADLDGKMSNSFHHRELLIDYIHSNGSLIVGARFSATRRICYPIPATVDGPHILRRWIPPSSRI